MKLEPFSEVGDKEWDRAVAHWQGRMIYHQAAWLKFIADSRPGLQLVRHRLIQDNVTRGYFVGFIEKKGPFLMLGSPLYGWVTDFMGPVSDEDLDVGAFLRSIEFWCRENRIRFLQIGHPFLPKETMCRAGYVGNEMSLYRIPLSGSENAMWQHITGKCRNRIRKGQKSGLRVEKCDDISIAEEYYAQHTDVFAHQGLSPKYPLRTVHSLVHTLMGADMILALRIRHKGETVATGIFPHDNQQLYSFGIASWVKYRNLCPNELLYWSAMQWGGAHGLQSFNIGGKYREAPSGGVFKEKFNGEVVPFRRYAKALSPVLGMIYRAYSMVRDIRSRAFASPAKPRLTAVNRTN